MDDVLERLREYQGQDRVLVSEVGDRIWDFAEIAHHELRSSALVREILAERGFAVKENVVQIPTAFAARFGNGGPTIGLLGEYDALPNLSQLPMAEHAEPIEGGAPGHGCGHNLIAAGMLAAANPQLGRDALLRRHARTTAPRGL